MQRVFIVISIVAACDFYRICSEVVKSELPDPDVLAQEIVVPRLSSLGTIVSQDLRAGRGPHRGVEDLEAALEQFREIAVDPRADVLIEKY